MGAGLACWFRVGLGSVWDWLGVGYVCFRVVSGRSVVLAAGLGLDKRRFWLACSLGGVV